MTPLEWLRLAGGFAVGLALFLYGLGELAAALEAVAGDRIKKWLAGCTTNRLLGVLTGTVATVALDSSSAVIVLVISLVRARLLNFTRALAVILGSNIGTTFSSFLFAFDQTRWLALACLVAGPPLRWLSRSERWQNVGRLVLALGLVFGGLEVIGLGTSHLKEKDFFEEMLEALENPIYGVLVGAGLTALIQSSSAMMGILIKAGVPLASGVPLMMGAEVGTCADTLVASVGKSRPALRAGVFHVAFNVLSVLAWLPFSAALAWAVSGVSGERLQLAVAHVIFNTSGVLVALPVLGWIAQGLLWVLPPGPDEKEEGERPPAGVEPQPA